MCSSVKLTVIIARMLYCCVGNVTADPVRWYILHIYIETLLVVVAGWRSGRQTQCHALHIRSAVVLVVYCGLLGSIFGRWVFVFVEICRRIFVICVRPIASRLRPTTELLTYVLWLIHRLDSYHKHRCDKCTILSCRSNATVNVWSVPFPI